MSQMPYPYVRIDDDYFFVSTGRERVAKVARFYLSDGQTNFNLCFGDLTFDNEINDVSNTNNGDMIRVLATVIQIIVNFLELHPYATVAFSGSTQKRINLYNRIVKRYYHGYANGYNIFGHRKLNNIIVKEPFDPLFEGNYLWHSINKKISFAP